MILDIGKKTIELINKTIDESNTVFWNGPAGYYENKNFSVGTLSIGKKIAENTKSKFLISIVGGGDTVAAIKNTDYKNIFTHLSTAGGAFLESLEGKDLPGIKVLKKELKFMSIEEIAKQMVAKGKGILASDESTGTMEKRLKSVNVDCTEKNRLNFREILFSSESMKTCISGVILFEETLRQKSSGGVPIPELIKKSGSIPGIKVDKGAKLLSGSDNEKITEGLDGLRDRLEEYYKLGARFAKWRAVYSISTKHPSEQCIKSNAHALARYAALVQEAKMVPIVEPEVLMDGDHSIDKCYDVTSKVLSECYNELKIQKVNLKGTVLKPNMIIPGANCKQKVSTEEIAKKTLDCIKKNMPEKYLVLLFFPEAKVKLRLQRI